MGLGGRQDHRPRELSGGEQQRVAIARALSNKPHLLLADEPTGNLDSHTSRDIMTILKDLNQREGKTIIMVTHDATLAGAYANRTITLLDGVVVDERSSSRGMTFRDTLSLALRNLGEAKLRTSLTTLGVSIGIASLAGMVSLGVGPAGSIRLPLHEIRTVRHDYRDARAGHAWRSGIARPRRQARIRHAPAPGRPAAVFARRHTASVRI